MQKNCKPLWASFQTVCGCPFYNLSYETKAFPTEFVSVCCSNEGGYAFMQAHVWRQTPYLLIEIIK